ncbi:hypothetical protein CDAR_35701 [Caerostris darwini]|uniref:Uncharacterized protein n=1 Tax=Caerostris darwini TaxID=1538125 RepID=A0AAV4VCW1_9ARAC|nr:hypothetical protein CDAR_35701 [Caerostris darwini]
MSSVSGCSSLRQRSLWWQRTSMTTKRILEVSSLSMINGLRPPLNPGKSLFFRQTADWNSAQEKDMQGARGKGR